MATAGDVSKQSTCLACKAVGPAWRQCRRRYLPLAERHPRPVGSEVYRGLPPILTLLRQRGSRGRLRCMPPFCSILPVVWMRARRVYLIAPPSPSPPPSTEARD